MKNISKIMIITVIRIIELAVMFYCVSWIYGVFPVYARELVILLFAASYCFYLGVTLSNEIYEMKHGEGEPFMPWM